MKKPNIIYLHSHDTGRNIQPYGNPIVTPVLQEFAETGVLFRKAFCVNPTCSPSRSGLLTGQYPHQNGMFGLSNGCALKSGDKGDFSLNDYSRHMVATLKKAGYFTALSGIQHVDGPNEDISDYAGRIGYDEILNLKYKEDMGKPFFLSVGLQETHVPFPDWRAIEDPKYCRPLEGFPDTPETRRDAARFKASARLMDRKMGDVLDALRESGKGKDTLVIITTDHGIPFPGLKCNLTDGGIGVMLMLRGPGGFSGGKIYDSLVSHLDIFPTICEISGIEPPQWLEGESLVSLVSGEAEMLRKEIFAEVNYHHTFEPQRCVRTDRWKYIVSFHHNGQQSCDGSETKDVFNSHGWQSRPVAEKQLYDLFFDPFESNNLVGKSEYVSIERELHQRLNSWMEETGDLLLKNKIPKPGSV